MRKSTTWFSLGLTTLGLLVFFVICAVGVFGHAAHAENNRGGRLITVHDRGQEQAFVTDKSTLKEAFADKGIKIDSHDAVEPSLDEKLVASDYQVNIYRARPVTVVDGAVREQIITPYQSAERIVKDAGITLYPEDTTTISRSDDIVSDGAGLQLTIDRATPITLDLYGSVTQIRTQGNTIAEMLKEKNIKLGASGRTSVPLDTPITSGMNVRVWREGKQTVTANEDVDFKVQQIQDADQPVGYKQVQTPGVKGKRTVTYEIEVQNGQEVSRHEIASITLSEAVTQVEVVGTKSSTLPYIGGGSKTEWLAASNIAQADWGYADFMVSHESGWNPNATNASSGACGLAQALPCSKVPGNPYNPVDSLNWMNGYAVGRYGSWENAYNFWVSHRWY